MSRSKFGEGQQEQVNAVFPVWRSIEIGEKSADQLIMEIQAKSSSSWDQVSMKRTAGKLVRSNKFAPLAAPTTVNLGRAKISDLGFTRGTTPQRIFNRIIKLDHGLCPPEVGLYLPLRHALEDGDSVHVAMNPICVDGWWWVLYIYRQSGTITTYIDVMPGKKTSWSPWEHVVFVLQNPV